MSDVKFDSRTPPVLVTVIVSMLSIVIGAKLIGFDLEKILDAYSLGIVHEIEARTSYSESNDKMLLRIKAVEEESAKLNERLILVESLAHKSK